MHLLLMNARRQGGPGVHRIRLLNSWAPVHLRTALLESFHHHSGDLLEKRGRCSGVDRVGEGKGEVDRQVRRALTGLSSYGSHCPLCNKFLEQRCAGGSNSLQ